MSRIVARKPKDVWAVRLSIGTYLMDGKHFKPLEIDDELPSAGLERVTVYSCILPA